MKWKFLMVGSRVRYVGNARASVRYGETGTIVFIVEDFPDDCDIAIDWDEKKFERHDCGGKSRPNHGWWVSPSEVQLIF